MASSLKNSTTADLQRFPSWVKLCENAKKSHSGSNTVVFQHLHTDQRQNSSMPQALLGRGSKGHERSLPLAP